MIYGTNCFVSKKAAQLYYRETEADIDEKIKCGAIIIGKPDLKSDEVCYIVPTEGRYFIKTNN